MIDRFTKREFEAALPNHRITGKPLWKALGIQDGEEAYSIEIAPNVEIHIRSSVRPDGYAAQVAKDSIRAWLAGPDGSPLGSKLQSYVTRVPGWQYRLTPMLRQLWKLGLELTKPCSKCGAHLLALKTKNGPNKGRWFVACAGKDFHWNKWLDYTDPKAAKKAAKKVA
jgi:hypothetical protein